MVRRTGSTSAAAWCVLAVAGTLLTVSCSPQATPSPSGAPTAAALTPSPAPAYADTLRVGYWNPGLLGGTTNTPYAYVYRGLARGILPSLTFVNVVYNSLYRYDAHFGTVPDLADGPCVPQADPTVIRCRIIETTFHDGSSLTADDVAYTFELLSQETLGQGGAATGSSFREARVVDARTVDFVLSARRPDVPVGGAPHDPDLPAPCRRGRVCRLRRPGKGPHVGRPHEARRHHRRGDGARSPRLHHPPRRGRRPVHAARRAPLSRGLPAGEWSVRRVLVHVVREYRDLAGRGGPRRLGDPGGRAGADVLRVVPTAPGHRAVPARVGVRRSRRSRGVAGLPRRPARDEVPQLRPRRGRVGSRDRGAPRPPERLPVQPGLGRRPRRLPGGHARTTPCT